MRSRWDFVDAAGISVESVNQLGPRQYNVSVSSVALGRAVDTTIVTISLL